MKDLFDVHCHMVPGVDDGASDLEESLAMLKMEYRDGVRNIIVTPHYRRRMFETPAKKVHEQFQKLQEAAKKEYPDLSLYLGCELHSNMDLQEILEKRKYVTMAGSSYVLLEFSEGDSAQHIRERVYNVLSCGYEPIIAHVERYQATVERRIFQRSGGYGRKTAGECGKYTWKVYVGGKTLLQKTDEGRSARFCRQRFPQHKNTYSQHRSRRCLCFKKNGRGICRKDFPR